jgi:hypothetical protein
VVLTLKATGWELWFVTVSVRRTICVRGPSHTIRPESREQLCILTIEAELVARVECDRHGGRELLVEGACDVVSRGHAEKHSHN